MKNNLIDRYIYAVVRRLPEKERKDVSLELDELISSMLAERAGLGENEEEQVRSVLNELGNPEELARNYGDIGKSCLIGEPHYSLYKRVLKIVLIAVGGALTFALLMEWLTGKPWNMSYELSDTISMTIKWIIKVASEVIDGLVGAFTAVTITFAILYHQGVKMDTEKFSLDNLPEVPGYERRSGIGELIGSLIFVSIFTVLFVILPQINLPCLFVNSQWYSYFNPEVLVSVRPLLIAFLVVILIEAVVKMMLPIGSVVRFLATLLANVTTVVTSLVWFGNPLVVNPEYISALKGTLGLKVWSVTELAGEGIAGLVGKFAVQPLPLMIALLIIIIVSIVEIVKIGVKTIRVRKTE